MFDFKTTVGRWPSILSALGVDSKTLSKRNVPCPMCDGKDRFRFTDKGIGMWHCNQCASGNGMQLVMGIFNEDFKAAVKRVSSVLPSSVEVKFKMAERRALLRRLWISSSPVSEDCPVGKYLANRCLWSAPISTALRSVPSCDYFEEGKKIGSFPAMIAEVRDFSGKPTTLHVTYLNHKGGKAKVKSPKKIVSATGEGAHVRLFPETDRLNVTEGIETALAVRVLIKQPVWSLIAASGFKSFVCPPGVKSVGIWSDADENFTGQAAAFALANRLAIAGKNVEVHLPTLMGSDWADEIKLA